MAASASHTGRSALHLPGADGDGHRADDATVRESGDKLRHLVAADGTDRHFLNKGVETVWKIRPKWNGLATGAGGPSAAAMRGPVRHSWLAGGGLGRLLRKISAPVLPLCFPGKIEGLSRYSLSPSFRWWSQPGSNR
ncbi:MAG TPA: hypothetical protein VFW83_05450 [Bryobacteraceae bacterium]|nr:hypothetical protein [Bryobacteraceae bacterium]